MGASDRVVRHLRLRADNESEVRHAARQLEDAMRCATLPDVGARVLLVRRLYLGRISPGVSSQTLALLLEQRVAAVGGAWVHGVDPSANEADYVFFRDALEVRIELALRLAADASVTSWYWKLAAPELKPLETPIENLRRIALALAALIEAPTALPAWVARLTSAGAASMLVAALGPTEGSSLVRAAGLVMRSNSQLPPTLETTGKSPSTLSRSRTSDDHQTVNLAEDVHHELTSFPLWLQTLAFAGGFAPKRVRLAHELVAAKHVTPARTNIDAKRKKRLRSDDAPSSKQEDNDMGIVRSVVREASPKSPSDDALEYLETREESGAEQSEPLQGWTLLDAAPTACGGLLFLLSALQRIGYPQWAETLPSSLSAEIVARMLAQILTCLHAPAEDVAWSFTHVVAANSLEGLTLTAPAVWQDPRLNRSPCGSEKNIVMSLECAQTADELAQVWLTVCRRWLRRLGGIGIASLVMRPASIRLTPTHADAFFRMSDVDVRVRRSGLDFDPGWLPWYGRVVSFYYGQEGQ
ncbi:MAG TPA: hypothetical protein VFW00_09380 [Rhodocyclaceae bacterium]|nr:hypothetical protein [Rhodocyclaceae bacterium]